MHNITMHWKINYIILEKYALKVFYIFLLYKCNENFHDVHKMVFVQFNVVISLNRMEYF